MPNEDLDIPLNSYLKPDQMASEPDFVYQLRDRLSLFDADVARFLEDEPEIPEMIEAATAIALIVDDAKTIYETLLAHLKDKMLEEGTEEAVATNGQQVEISFSKTRRAWQHRELASIVAGRIFQSATDPDTGEILLSTQEMIESMLDYVQPSGWKIKALEGIGLNADNYCDAGDSSSRIYIRKAK